MSDARTKSQEEFAEEFAAEFAKHFGKKSTKSTLTERGFCQPFDNKTMVGSLYDIGGKSSKFKADHGIDPNTPGCHVYFNDVHGNYIIGEDTLYTSFEQLMIANPSF
jgi:hypothetical protein